jgi:hypothetical protein
LFAPGFLKTKEIVSNVFSQNASFRKANSMSFGITSITTVFELAQALFMEISALIVFVLLRING